MSKFLVAGHPRGGTTWMAMVFRRLGYDVAHERAIRVLYQPELLRDGEVSWSVALWKDRYPPDWPILQIVRHPYKVVRSMYRLKMFQDGQRWLNWVRDERQEKRVVEDVCPEVLTTDDEILRAARFYVSWHEQHTFFNNPFLHMKVESIATDQWAIHQAVHHLTGDRLLPEQLNAGIELRTDFNSAEERTQANLQQLTYPDLKRRLANTREGAALDALTAEFGYSMKELG